MASVAEALAGALRAFTRFCAGHRATLDVMTVVEAAVIFVAMVCLWVIAVRRDTDEDIRRGDRWVLYFALGFGAFAAMYAIRLVLGSPAAPITGRILPFVSGVTSLLFLAAARGLLLRSPVTPVWAWLLAHFRALSVAFGQHMGIDPYHAVLDGAFSGYCVGLLGYALARGAAARRSCFHFVRLQPSAMATESELQ